MLSRLLKYDFRALTRILLPLQGGVLIAALIGSLLVRLARASFDIWNDGMLASSAAGDVIGSTSVLLSFLLFAAVFASYWITLFLIARHYYQSFLKDEGYLTFTLPVSTGQNLLSKVIAGSIWLLVNVVILILAFILLFVVGYDDSALGGFSLFSSDAGQSTSGVLDFVSAVELFVLGLLLVIHGVLQVYVSITMGAVIAQTHKVLAGIGLFVGINIAMQLIMSILTFSLANALSNSFSVYSQYDWFSAMQVLVLPSLIICGGLVVFYFVLSKRLLTKRLNLD